MFLLYGDVENNFDKVGIIILSFRSGTDELISDDNYMTKTRIAVGATLGAAGGGLVGAAIGSVLGVLGVLEGEGAASGAWSGGLFIAVMGGVGGAIQGATSVAAIHADPSGAHEVLADRARDNSIVARREHGTAAARTGGAIELLAVNTALPSVQEVLAERAGDDFDNRLEEGGLHSSPSASLEDRLATLTSPPSGSTEDRLAAFNASQNQPYATHSLVLS